MFNRGQRWLDDRTGWKAFARRIKNRPVPARGQVGQALGAALASTLAVVALTGVLLSLVYSPSAGSAWGSVYYLDRHVDAGWIVRGVHRFGTYASVVLGILWVGRLVLAGGYRPPREVTWVLALAIVALILAAGVTGNILPWDQRGYWAAVVETTIIGGLPVVGAPLRRLVVGGSDLGNATLTRVHALHVVVLPVLLGVLGYVRFRWSRRVEERPDHLGVERELEAYWPRLAFIEAALATLTLGLVLALTLWNHGYSLDAPADPTSEHYQARPEWYFLPLYQLLRVFQGREIIATVVLPTAVVLGFLALPLLDRFASRRVTRALSGAFYATVLGVSTFLTYQALAKDARSDSFQAARAEADHLASHAASLADRDGIPPEGAAYLLRLDPDTRGAEVFAAKCLSCHNFDGSKREGQWAPALARYGSKTWIRGLLEKPDSPDYFGLAPMCGGMTQWKKGSELDAAALDKVADYLALMARTPADMTPGEWLATPEAKEHPGREPYETECAACHTFGDPAEADGKTNPAPDLFAWGSERWTGRMIREPSHASLYGYLKDKQKMPAFGDQLTASDLSVLSRYLRAVPEAGRPASPGAGL